MKISYRYNQKGGKFMYIVKEGDNLLSIARTQLGCHTKYAELIRRNHLVFSFQLLGHAVLLCQ